MDRRTEDDTAPGEEQREPEPVRADGRPADSMDEITEPAGSGGTGPDEADHHNVADSTGDDEERFDAG
ncbi:hypothetical protein IGS67_08260 [Flavimobilis sp. GY10621]|uniref:Uncharacterized protein n=1 Tax=Flavimobilis rhizosphaerae TaxID=2775421 RepID=A0ABR9DQU1_9MICO|nr:hypothetical protein [Flavimobilis rhizosphaerae]MBD9699481.1 hypothetical protein [Flavimobilis rhizosphaerae]